MHPDLKIFPDFVSDEEQVELIRKLNQNIDIQTTCANPAERNRVWRYGRYKPTIINVCKAIPDYLDVLSERLVSLNLLKKKPDVVSVNEYEPGRGIEAHIDSLSNGDIISILGLGSHTVLNFRKKHEVLPFYFPPKTMVQMTGDIRYNWQHYIEAKKSDIINGEQIDRGTRYSVVFRQSCH